MGLGNMLRRVAKLADDNSPALLTAAGVAGVVITAFLTARSAAKSAEIIRVVEEDHGEQITTGEKAELVWKQYIPPFCAGAVTITCIVLANRIGTRRVAAMAALAAVSERAYEEYKLKVRERVGEHKERAIRDEINQMRVDQQPPKSNEVFIVGEGEVLFMDSFTRRYFKSTVEKVRRAENDINARIVTDFYASLTEFYDLIGLPKTAYSDEVGWNLDNRLKVNFTTAISEEQKPCMVIDFDSFPKVGFEDFR